MLVLFFEIKSRGHIIYRVNWKQEIIINPGGFPGNPTTGECVCTGSQVKISTHQSDEYHE